MKKFFSIISIFIKENKAILFISGIILTFPIIFTQFHFLDFSETGGIGDTLSGITAPFLNIMAAILVYRTLRAQIDANEKLNSSNETITKINRDMLEMSRKNNDHMEIGNIKLIKESVDIKISSFNFETDYDVFSKSRNSDIYKYSGITGIYTFFEILRGLFENNKNNGHSLLNIDNFHTVFKNRNVFNIFQEIDIILKSISRFTLVCDNSTLFKEQHAYFMFYHTELATTFNKGFRATIKNINALIGGIDDSEGNVYKKGIIDDIKEKFHLSDDEYKNKLFNFSESLEGIKSSIEIINESINSTTRKQT